MLTSDSENSPCKFVKFIGSKHVTSKTFPVYKAFEKIIFDFEEMACNGVLTPSPLAKIIPSPVLKFSNPLSPQTFYSLSAWKQKTWRCEANAQISHSK